MLAAPTPDDAFPPGLLSAGTLLGLFVGYGLGFVHAVWRRARTDYIKTKELIPGLRSDKWAAWRQMLLRGAIVVAVLGILIVWLVSATRGQPSSQ